MNILTKILIDHLLEYQYALLNKLEPLVDKNILPAEFLTKELSELESALSIISLFEENPEFVSKSVSTYTAQLLSIVRSFYRTEDIDEFTDRMTSAVQDELTQMWFAGMKECGFTPEEISDDEQSALDNLINTSLGSISGFADDILAGKEAGKTPNDFNFRIAIWALRSEESFNQSRIMACADEKLKWVLGDADHCSTCLKLSNKVKRASSWDTHGVYPQITDGSLECGGFRCKCSLIPTNEPLSRGPLPNVP